MIISHRYKFIFIKTVKTAGTSIEIFLSQLCGEEDVVTPIIPHVEPHRARNHRGIWNPLPEIIAHHGRRLPATLRHLWQRRKFYNHIPARYVRDRIPAQIWNQYFKFAVERNPWDKTLSHFHMVADRAGGGLTLDQYLHRGKFCLNFPKYTDANGRLIVDRVLKFESLMDDLAAVFGQLGVPFHGTLRVRAKSGHRKDPTPYQQVFTPEQRSVIEKAFAREIALHGYTYDGLKPIDDGLRRADDASGNLDRHA